MRHHIYLWLLLLGFLPAFGQQASVHFRTADPAAIPHYEREIIPNKYRTVKLDLETIKSELKQAPMRGQFQQRSQMKPFSIPMPDGTTQRFLIYESPVMAPGLAAKYPQIKTYGGFGVDDPHATIRLGWGEDGFNAMILMEGETVFIDPYQKNDQEHYVVYYKKDYGAANKAHHFGCLLDDDNHNHNSHQRPTDRPSLKIEGELRTYRLALATTGEYSAFHGGTVPLVLSELNVAMNRVNGIYLRDFGIFFQLINNNDQLIYLNGATDPYTNFSGGAMLAENQNNLTAVIGGANYDIGHVFSTGGGGIASLASVCSPNFKARGVTGLGSPINDPFYVDFVAHEIGHQVGGPHTFNGSSGACAGGNRSGNNAFEPGSGTTIMAYAGICGGDNLQNNSDDYFHTGSIQDIVEYMIEGFGSSCATITTTNNLAPDITMPNLGGTVIPISTPFKLVGEATDPNGDAMTYCWEQVDLGPAGNPNNPQQNAAIFRSFDPTPSPVRYLPRLNDLVNNTTIFGEILPSYSRTLTFRLTVRDGVLTGAGVAHEEVEFIATAQAGPFVVSNPNSNDTWSVGELRAIEWDVANTNQAPVNCKTVNILLSTDGGFTYTDTLVKNTANDGSEVILVPNQVGSSNRIMVEAADNIFFDISNQNFTIQNAPQTDISAFNLQNTWNVCRDQSNDFVVLTSGVGGYTGPVSVSILGLLPGVTFTTSPTNPVAGDTITVTLAANSTALIAPTSLNVVITGVSGEDDLLTIPSNVLANVQASTAIVAPSLGELGVSRRPVLVWNNATEADSYILEVATSPSFDPSTIVETQSFVLDTQTQVRTQLEGFTPYYWRVAGANVCGRGNFTAFGAFQTGNCLIVSPNDLPQDIPAFGTNIQVSSDVFVPFTGVVTDVNVIDLNVEHGNNSQLTFLLRSPDQTVGTLSSAVCGTSSDFYLGYDDEAVNSLIGCTVGPTDTQSFIPLTPLSAFDGGPSGSGVAPWTLSILDNIQGTGGRFVDWKLEVCNAGASAPILLRNETLWLEAGNTRVISDLILRAQEITTLPADMIFTIVTLPDSGTIALAGAALTIGSTFTQEDINNGDFTYTSNGAVASADQFDFTVTSANGGWLGVPTFEIDVRPVSNDDVLENGWSIYPNPAQDILMVEWDQVPVGNVSIKLFDVQGRTIITQTFANVQQIEKLDVSRIPSGVYGVQVSDENGIFVRKVLIER
ncbi:MAG: reprolysin-like metallopeptidase [Bacteroidota bacterium]